jgi:hypothetical protein
MDKDEEDDGRLVEGVATDSNLQLPLSGNGHRDWCASVPPRAGPGERHSQRAAVISPAMGAGTADTGARSAAMRMRARCRAR